MHRQVSSLNVLCKRCTLTMGQHCLNIGEKDANVMEYAIFENISLSSRIHGVFPHQLHTLAAILSPRRLCPLVSPNMNVDYEDEDSSNAVRDCALGLAVS